MRKGIVFCYFIIATACGSKYSKENHVATDQIKTGIFLEVFETYSGGTYAGSSYSYYLTDSLNFRKFLISKEHDDELIKTNIKDDTVSVIKIGNAYNLNQETIKTKRFVIRELVASRQWD